MFREIEIIDSNGSPLGEIDGIDVQKKVFYEDKKASNFNTINPLTGKPQQTEQQWAKKQIYDKTSKRIKALQQGVSTRRTVNGSKDIPDFKYIRTINHFIFRLEGDTIELKKATQEQIDNLRKDYPNYKFDVIYGVK